MITTAEYESRMTGLDAHIAMSKRGVTGAPVHEATGKAVEAADNEAPDHHRNAPQPDPACLYGLVGEVARAGSQNIEANTFAIALNFMSYLSCAIGRGAFTYIGNTRHHVRIFGLHVGRTGRGRKGDAASLVHRIDMAICAADAANHDSMAPQVHSGGLSTREGLALMIHDGWGQGKKEVEPIHDKRLWVVESEFVNVLMQSKRDGNTLSSALRDFWDGVSIKPATKGQPRVWASNPHICLSAGITGSELHNVMAARELTNGFANRFTMIWAERTRMLPFPRATPQPEVDALARRAIEVIRFAGGDRFAERDVRMIGITPAAERRYAELYLGELNDQSAGEIVTALLERRAPVLRRLAMLFALCDLQCEVDVQHIDAALAWTRYWTDSVKFIFSDGAAEVRTAEINKNAQAIIDFLQKNERASRAELTKQCFGGHKSKTLIDDALDELLTASPARIVVRTVPRPKGTPGAPTKIYFIAAKCAKSANSLHSCGLQPDSGKCEVSEVCELSEDSAPAVSTVRTVRKHENQPQSHANIKGSQISHSSQHRLENLSADDFEVF